MKLIRYAFALAALMPAIGAAQGAAPAAQNPLATVLEKMQKNAIKISVKPENDRWAANVTLWQTRLDHMGALGAGEFKKVQPVFDAMKANVAKIEEPMEKERWEANVALWQITLDAKGVVPASAEAKMKGALEKMEANVGKIGAGAERERWDRNVELWKALVAKK